MATQWTADAVAKLQSMAGKHAPAEIAAELGRGLSATKVKAHKLRISLRLEPKRGSRLKSADPEGAGMDPTGLGTREFL